MSLIINPYALGAGVIAGNVLDLQADTLSLSDADPVATWPDQSGNANDASQSTTSKKPTYRATAGPGSRPCVDFDGGDWMTLTNNITSHPVTIFAVVKTSASGDKSIISGDEFTGFKYQINSGPLKQGIWAGGSPIDASNNAVSSGVFTSIAITWEGSSGGHAYAFYKTGSADGSGTSNTSSTAITSIGANNDETVFFNGSICMIRVYNRILTSGEISTVVAEILTRWGV